jgi:DNA-binding NarL/FixJ family response regulator
MLDVHLTDGEPSAEPLAAAILAADQSTAEDILLREVWGQLVGGACTVLCGFFSQTRFGIVVRRIPESERRPLARRQLELLQGTLAGSSQKRMALEAGLACSTVAVELRAAIRQLGCSCRPSRAHPILMLMASAASTNSHRTAALGSLRVGGVQMETIGLARPEANADVTPAERAIVRLLVEGVCYAKISRSRGRSRRTIANQVAAVFRRLNVSGRNELVHYLLADDPPRPQRLRW